MAAEHFPLLFLDGPNETRGFTTTMQGGGGATLPTRVATSHSVLLEDRLTRAWADAEGRQATGLTTRQGCYIEFVSAPGADLALKSLESVSTGIRLLNVRTHDDGRTLATVYVPSAQRSYFLNRIRDYGDATKNTKRGNPKNQPLVASIDDIAAAVLKDFWTDRAPLPERDPKWVEVWLATEDAGEIDGFRTLLAESGIEEHPHHPVLRFPERSVLLILANAPELTALISRSNLIAELRAARELPTFFLDLSNRDQAEWCQNLVDRLDLKLEGNVSVCILDQGVNRGHPLIDPILSPNDLHTFDPAWGTADHGGHGTLMAGLTGYGDLQACLESSATITITHCLESSKILPPPPAVNPKHLWGYVTSQAIYRAETEAPDRKRIICLAVAAEETRDAGHPTSWSAELDALAAGVDEINRRLIVVCAGNVTGNWESYPVENLTNEVHDPAQAWNALSVGACTFRTRLDPAVYLDYEPIAQAGELSPFSTTSAQWDHDRWPIKPEIVVEGGNVARTPGGEMDDPEDLRLLSTCHNFTRSHFWPFGGTSSAAAQVAWMSARIQATYPHLWPETLRGLLVHSASWTPALISQFQSGTGKAAYRNLLRACGYGVPDLEKALSCVRNSLTLIAQHDIQPFIIRGSTRATNEMHLYALPWPLDELLQLGETQVRMRITLSYFIEPGPGEVGWSHRYRYASHGLRFELNSPGESQTEFVKRINKQAREQDEGKPETEAPSDHWMLGQQRNVGSIHSDIWTGRAADLATSNLIAVRPVVGWWRERHHLRRVEQQTRYSLIVSVETPSEETDIYTPVAAKIGIITPVPIQIPTI